MPFVNQHQRAACYAQQNSALKNGEVPKWNCKEFENMKCKYGKNKDGFCNKKPIKKSRSPNKFRSKSHIRKTQKIKKSSKLRKNSSSNKSKLHKKSTNK